MRDSCLQDWMDRETLAESMIPMIGSLYRQKSIISSIYGRPVINRSVIDLLKAHRFVRHMENTELAVQETYPILEALTKMEVAHARIDLGKLAVKFRESGSTDLTAFLQDELSEINGKEASQPQNSDVKRCAFSRSMTERLITGRP